mgnify:CR=1 FL=1
MVYSCLVLIFFIDTLISLSWFPRVEILELGSPSAEHRAGLQMLKYMCGAPRVAILEGGCGWGGVRLWTWRSGAEHIREAIPFPRDSRRVTP